MINLLVEITIRNLYSKIIKFYTLYIQLSY